MPFKRILCAVDFSESSVRAFHNAVETAKQFRSALRVLHVIEADPVVSELLPRNGLGQIILTLEDKAKASMQALLESSARELEGIKFSTEINDGNPSEQVLDSAREWKADLITLGAKGVTTLDEAISGGTTLQVVREAPCSVLVVR